MQHKPIVATRTVVELFLISAVSLYVELLLIRWMSADIRAFTVFRTFPLVSCFVGLGLGMARGDDKPYRFFPLIALALCIVLKVLDWFGLSNFAFPSLAVFQWGNLAGMGGVEAIYVVLILLLVIILLALPFGICVTIGSRLGVLFNQLDPLPAYSYNLLGAIFGSIAFQSLNYLGLAPPYMLLLPLLIAVIFQLRDRKPKLADFAPFAIIPLLFLIVPDRHAMPLIPELLTLQTGKTSTYWSPYQRIDVSVFSSKPTQVKPAEFVGLELSTNHTFYQYLFDTRNDTLLSTSDIIKAIREDYALPFDFNKSKSVLVVGAGTGQNVSFALEGGAQVIDAVEIDPVILNIGRMYNADYSSPKVRLICDDARHFFSQSKQRYDVIDFSTLDSHTVTGFGSSVRLDSYVYTKESIAKALSLLNDDGVLVVTFATVAPWTRARLYRTFAEAAGYPPMLLQGHFSSSIFVMGPHVKDGSLPVPSSYTRLSGPFNSPYILTDDWPYLYVQPNVIDYPYLLVVAEVLLISLFVARRHLFRKNDASTWQMLFLGAAFMLLELHAISFLSLLYGSTWNTSALVINGILITILLANMLVIKLGTRITHNQTAVYSALLLAILVSYFLPTENLLNSLHRSISFTILTVFTILPMGVAALAFSSAFSKVPDASRAIAFNLFGAVLGGLLEYLSNYLGIRNLLLVAALLYLVSYLFHLSSNRKPQL